MVTKKFCTYRTGNRQVIKTFFYDPNPNYRKKKIIEIANKYIISKNILVFILYKTQKIV